VPLAFEAGVPTSLLVTAGAVGYARDPEVNIMVEQTPFSIVVDLDFKPTGGRAFEEAARVAKSVPLAAIHLVHVFSGQLDDAERRKLVGQLRLYVNEKAASLGGLGGVTVGIHLRSGHEVREIVQLASDVQAGLIVVGTNEKPHKHWVLNLLAERLLHAAPCPVLVAGPKPEPVAHEPAIEPPCADCLKARASSKGNTWWCERHAHKMKKAHVFSYERAIPLAEHDSEVIPTGIDV
jgi:nucleotide-binding universal stress UspA family protein